MGRSKWKNIITIEDVNDSFSQIQKRNCIITPSEVSENMNKKIKIHNGKEYSKEIRMSLDHIGHLCGEYVTTKKVAIYKKGKK